MRTRFARVRTEKDKTFLDAWERESSDEPHATLLLESAPGFSRAHRIMRELAQIWESSAPAPSADSQFVRPDLIPPRGWASTDDCGERREPVTLTTSPDGCPALARGVLRIDGGPLPGHRVLIHDLIQAHNAYFCTDPAEEAKLDRELGEALRQRASAKAEKAAVVIIDFLDRNRRSLAPDTLAACIRAIIETETRP